MGALAEDALVDDDDVGDDGLDGARGRDFFGVDESSRIRLTGLGVVC